ncbi:fibronectin type III domain-containing protein [Catellatospora tritici]|uniref:fibronectin type III domain-containing protein n=1 Tax=Catellatospora tritici TaxID=2851566 RepID=UPI001C2D7CFC|nr:fibronectin type III domain-containing protein [Catellatospora tritici]MBV1852596.1 fibronectin type III domain-containing protein [Catellatospora tritici]
MHLSRKWVAAGVLASLGVLASVLWINRAEAHPIPGGGLNGKGVETLCHDATGFSCTKESGYDGTGDQVVGLGWLRHHYWDHGTPGPNGTRHNCTTYAAYRLKQNGYAFPGWTGDATTWAKKAATAKVHVTVDQTPAVGSIAQWVSGKAGHVAYVESVSSTYIETTSDSYQFGAPKGTDHLRIQRGSEYMPDNFIHFKDIPQSVPAQPTSPRVTATTADSAVLNWSDASNNEDSFVSQYRIGSGSWTGGPTAGANTTSITVAGLRPGTDYTFQVGAKNIKGTKWSAYFSGRTPYLPAEPTDPKIKSMTDTAAQLIWKDASNNEDSFVSQYRVGEGPWIAGPAAAVNATSVTVGGLQAATSYTFQIGAKNAAGTKWSAYVVGTTAQTLAVEPANPSISATTDTTATLTWTDASTNEDSFVSQYRIGSGSWKAGPVVGANATSMTVSGLQAATSYVFQIGAKNAAGTKWSAYVTGTTAQPAPTLPAEPTNPRVTSTTTTSTVLAWTDVANNEQIYVSQYRIGSGSWIAGPTVGANATSMTVNGLQPATSYTFQIGAKNAVGTKWSAYVYGSTAQSQTAYHAGFSATVDKYASTGLSGHKGPGDQYAAGPTHPIGAAIHIYCYVDGQSITNSHYNYTTTIWDLSDDGYFYTDAWLYTGTNGAVVPKCGSFNATVDRYASTGLSGHKGPGDQYSAGPTHPIGAAIHIYCYVDGQSITNSHYNYTTTIWNLSDDGYWYTDAWLYTGTNGAVVPRCR